MKQAFSTWDATPSQWVNILHFINAGLVVTLSILIASTAEALSQRANALGVTIPYNWITGLWLGLLVIGLLYGLWHYLVVVCTSYTLTTGQLRERHGVLNRATDSLELYRIKDVRVINPLLFRPLGLGHVQVDSSDRTTPRTLLKAIKNADQVGKLILREAEKLRVKKGVREFD